MSANSVLSAENGTSYGAMSEFLKIFNFENTEEGQKTSRFTTFCLLTPLTQEGSTCRKV